MDVLRVTCRESSYLKGYTLEVNIISSDSPDNITQYVFNSKTPFPKPEWQALIDGYGDKQVAYSLGYLAITTDEGYGGDKFVYGGLGLSVCETNNSYYLITDEEEPEESRDQPNILVKVPRALLAPELAKALGLEPPVNLENNIKG